MALPNRLGRFDRVVTNRVASALGRWLPGFGLVLHEGRRTGTQYRTPVNVFWGPDGYVIALTYGAGTDWLKNVLAAGRCEVITVGQRRVVTDPRVVHDPSRSTMPFVVRPVLAALRVNDFLHLTHNHS